MIYNLPGRDALPTTAAAGGGTLTPDHVYNLCCIFGDVARIRLLNKPEHCAMVEFMTPRMVSMGTRQTLCLLAVRSCTYHAATCRTAHRSAHYSCLQSLLQAATAMDALQRLPLYGKVLKLEPSKHQSINMTGGGGGAGGAPSAAGSMGAKDFTDCLFHRYRSEKYRAQHADKTPNAPCSSLYFTNYPAALAEEHLRTALVAAGAEAPTSIRMLPERDGSAAATAGRRSGFIDFPTLEHAAAAAMLLNNTMVFQDEASVAAGAPLRGLQGLRISFANRPAGTGHGAGAASGGSSTAAASLLSAPAHPSLLSSSSSTLSTSSASAPPSLLKAPSHPGVAGEIPRTVSSLGPVSAGAAAMIASGTSGGGGRDYSDDLGESRDTRYAEDGLDDVGAVTGFGDANGTPVAGLPGDGAS